MRRCCASWSAICIEADVGDLIEALDPELRPRLVELMGHDFDFTALTEVDDTVREEILEELPAETVAEGVRELDSDDAVVILEDLPKDEQAEILDQLPADERDRARAQPRLPGELGRPAHADRVHRGRPPLGPWARPSTTCARRPTCRSASGSSTSSIRTAGSKAPVALDRLLRTKRPVPIAELIDEELRPVRVTDDQEEVARMFERYDLVSAPVVDARRPAGRRHHLRRHRRRDRGGGRGGHQGARRRRAAKRNCPTRCGPSPRAASPGCSPTC